MLTYQVGGVKSHIKQWVFPAGEVGVIAYQPLGMGQEYATIRAHMHNSDDVMALLMLVDALRRMKPDVKLILDMPYIPYARQDRVCNRGEGLSIAVFAQLINSCNFTEVHVVDPHSDVAPALINGIKIRDQVDVFRNIKLNWSNTIIVAPDAGAYKKSHKFAQAVGARGVAVCHKIRDVVTGEIQGMELTDKIDQFAEYLVLDDLCDGGRTFTEIANLFSTSPVRLDLAVTHGIFTKGVEVVANVYDNVYTTNSYWGTNTPEAINVIWKEV